MRNVDPPKRTVVTNGFPSPKYYTIVTLTAPSRGVQTPPRHFPNHRASVLALEAGVESWQPFTVQMDTWRHGGSWEAQWEGVRGQPISGHSPTEPRVSTLATAFELIEV